MNCCWLIVFYKYKNKNNKKNNDLQFLFLKPPNIQTYASTFHLHVVVSQNLWRGT